MTHPLKDLSHNLPANDGNIEVEKLAETLDYLNDSTVLRELLEMCLEENTDCEGNTKNTRIELLIDCYLSRSEFFIDELRIVLEKWR
ncbi:MAG TPA: hypothetical protein V6D48_14805 [Oculatellaceae cyanobacterium]